MEEKQGLDTKRFVLFLALSMGVLFAWNWLVPKPPMPVVPPPGAAAAAGASAPDATAAGGTESPVASGAAAPGTPEAAGVVGTPPVEVRAEAAPRRVRMATPLADVEVSNVGGRLTSWQLPGQGEYGDKTRPLELVKRRLPPGSDPPAVPGAVEVSDSQDILPLQVISGNAALDAQLAKAPHVLELTESGGTHVLTASWSDGAGTHVEKSLTLRDDSRVAMLRARLTVKGKPVAFHLAWGPGLGNHTKGDRGNRYFHRGQVSWRTGGKTLIAMTAAKADGLELQPVDWAAMEDSFFTVLVVPAVPAWASVPGAPEASAGDATPLPAAASTGFLVTGPATVDAQGKKVKVDWPEELVLGIPFTPAADVQALYAGPREREILDAIAPIFGGQRDLVSLLHLGMLQPIALLMHSVLLWLFELTHSWGAAIVLLTLVIRGVLFPLTHVSLKKMRALQEKMKVLKPRETALKDRFRKLPRTAENRMREQQERLALYQEVGIAPTESLSGCLPLLLSMPFFWALFRLLPYAPEFRHVPFLFWPDLASADPTHVWPLLTALTMFVSSKVGMAKMPNPDPMQQNMMYVLPLAFASICWGAPLGLVVYWTMSNVIQIGQQYLLQLTLPKPDEAPRVALASGGGKPRKKGSKR